MRVGPPEFVVLSLVLCVWSLGFRGLGFKIWRLGLGRNRNWTLPPQQHLLEAGHPESVLRFGVGGWEVGGRGLGVGGWGLGVGIWGLGFGVWGLGFGFWNLGFRFWGLGFRVWGLEFGVWVLGFRV